MDELDPIGQLIETLNSPDSNVREEAIEELSYFIDNPKALEALVLCLEDENRLNQDLTVSILSQYDSPEVIPLLIGYLTHKDFYVRNSAIKIIKSIGRNYIDVLFEAFENSDDDSRIFIIEIINSFKNPEAGEFLANYLDLENDNILYNIIEGLGIIRYAPMIDKLLEIAENHQETALRIAAINALGVIGESSVKDKLIDFLKSDDPMVVFSSVDALGFIGNQDAVNPLIQLYEETYPIIQEMIIIAIIRIETKSGQVFLDRFSQEEVKKQLLNALEEDDEQIKKYAISEFNRYFDLTVFDKLFPYLTHSEYNERVNQVFISNKETAFPIIQKKILEREFEPEEEIVSIRLLVEDGDECVKEIFRNEYQNSDPGIRAEVAHGIGKLGIVDLEGIISSLLDDEVGNVRKAATNAVGWALMENLVDQVFELLSDPYPDVREAALGSLVFIGNKAIIQRFVEMLKTNDDNEKLYAIKALSWIGVKDVIPYLEETLKSPHKIHRKISIESLVRMGSIESAPKIIESLYDEDHQNRQTAVNALVSLNYKDAFPHVVNLINDKNMWVRYVAAKNILALDHHAAVPYVKEIFSGKDELAILGVLQGLEYSFNSEFFPYLEILSNSNNSDIRMNAMKLIDIYKKD